MTEPVVIPLGDLTASDLALAGGKAANLGELLRAGQPVPPGFVVTTAGYGEAADQAGLPALLVEVETDPAALRAAIEQSPVPAGIRRAITDAYETLGHTTPVAVRSSATAEDLPGAAFAGQQDTYLNVVGTDAVIDAVRRCWASLWTDRAVAYRGDREIDAGEVRIAVVVQRMVDADLAGVMFTADPVSGARDRIVIDAGAGLGEAVVSGLVTPDHYLLDHRGRRMEWTPGRNEVVIRAAPGGGIRHDDSENSALGAPLLGPEDLSALAAHAQAIAAHFGRPQDIEWAIADGRVRILQARPMTALPPPSTPMNRRQRLLASMLTEYLPIRPYPMDVTTLVTRGPAGVMSAVGRYYGVAGVFEDFLREEDGVAAQIVPSSPHPTPRTVTRIGTIAGKIRRFHPGEWATDSRHADLLAEVDALEAIDLGALSWKDLVAVPPRAIGAEDYVRDLRIDYLPGAAAALIRVVIATTLLGQRALIADLLGGVRTRTEESNDALAALADDVRSDPALRELLDEKDAEEAFADVRSNPRFAGFDTRLTAFLNEFGRRETTSLLLVSPPTLAESPEIVLSMVQALAAQPPRADDSAPRSAAALDRLGEHPLLRHSTRLRAGMVRRVQRAREGVAFREDTHFLLTATLPTLRRALLEIGRRLHATGILDRSEQIFQLRWEEVAAMPAPAEIRPVDADALRARIRAREAKRAELDGIPMIDPLRVFPAADTTGDALVTGTPAGAGTATGTARIVLGADDFDRLGEGEILVCPYTNPAWTPLFRRASAVVVDTGSTASHAAIVAREYGIPAVMGTANGTTAIRDGETITVDGARGRVTRRGTR